MSVRGVALRGLIGRYVDTGQSRGESTLPGHLAIVGADQAVLGNWNEWFPGTRTRVVGERLRTVGELTHLLGQVVDPSAIVLLPGLTEVSGRRLRDRPDRSDADVAAMIRVATERARAAPTLLVGVPAALEDSAPARWNRLLEHRCREAGIGFIEPSVHDDRLAPRTVLGMTAWSAETYATVASAVASALGFTVGVARGGRAGALRGGLTSRAAQLRSEHFQMLPSPAGRAVVLGDSITEGGSWSRWLPGVDVVNRGVGGDQIADVLRRLDTAVDQPTVVSLLIGTNDLAHGGDGAGVDAIVGRFGDLVLEITRRTSAPLIVNSVMPRQRRFAQRITLLNTHQRAVADEYGARWIDLWPTMATAGGAIRRELSTDGLHLNAAGYEAWARELAPAIAAALSP